MPRSMPRSNLRSTSAAESAQTLRPRASRSTRHHESNEGQEEGMIPTGNPSTQPAGPRRSSRLKRPVPEAESNESGVSHLVGIKPTKRLRANKEDEVMITNKEQLVEERLPEEARDDEARDDEQAQNEDKQVIQKPDFFLKMNKRLSGVAANTQQLGKPLPRRPDRTLKPGEKNVSKSSAQTKEPRVRKDGQTDASAEDAVAEGAAVEEASADRQVQETRSTEEPEDDEPNDSAEKMPVSKVPPAAVSQPKKKKKHRNQVKVSFGEEGYEEPTQDPETLDSSNQLADQAEEEERREKEKRERLGQKRLEKGRPQMQLYLKSAKALQAQHSSLRLTAQTNTITPSPLSEEDMLEDSRRPQVQFHLRSTEASQVRHSSLRPTAQTLANTAPSVSKEEMMARDRRAQEVQAKREQERMEAVARQKQLYLASVGRLRMRAQGLGLY